MAARNLVPVDKGWAWVIVLGTFGSMAVVVGTLKSFGVLLVELSHRYDAPASLLASSQSLCGWLHLAFAPVSNILCQRFGHRWVVFCGGILSAIGLVATSFVRDIEWFFITYGIITGVGFGLIVATVLVFPSFYFDKKLPLALGLASSGSGMGSFIFPNLMRFLLDEYSVSGCLLILGGILLHICAFALLFRPTSYWRRENIIIKPLDINKKKTWKKDIEMNFKEGEHNELLGENSPCNITSVLGYESTLVPQKGILHSKSLPSLSNASTLYAIRPSNSENNIYPTKIFTNYKLSKRISTPSTKLEERDKNTPKPPIINLAMFKDPLFILVNVGVFLATFGHHNSFNFVPPLADELGFSESEGALSVSIVGITDLIGRVSSGIIGNAFFKRRVKLYIICLLVFSTGSMIVVHINYFYVFIVLCGVLGLTTGGFIGVQISTIADELGRENLSTAWGYVAFTSSFSILINPALSGAIKDSSGSWKNAFRMSSACGFLGSAILLIEIYVRKRLQEKNSAQ
ncbi:monocarboxylate transporter 13-like [Saccostrea echinata]|uniref:monocarboxylate transporter 13-like n=1 Tax=Saccostrea echinata TaxID=191078 RepID=UPI002A83C02B|nr:monocarboxylate transporter 13-like [Saccostrea echinata]